MHEADEVSVTTEMAVLTALTLVPAAVLALIVGGPIAAIPLVWLRLVFGCVFAATPAALAVFGFRNPLRPGVWITRAVVSTGSYLLVSAFVWSSLVSSEVLAASSGQLELPVILASWVGGVGLWASSCYLARRLQVRLAARDAARTTSLERSVADQSASTGHQPDASAPGRSEGFEQWAQQ